MFHAIDTLVGRLGRPLLDGLTGIEALLIYIGGVALLAGRTALAVPGALSGRRRRYGIMALTDQMVRVGVKSLPFVFLVSIFVGVILLLQSAPILQLFGAEAEAARITAVAIVRELAPLLSSIILAGYAGCAIAAELGTMRVSEEIDALEAGAIDPVRFLVVPRVVATIITVTALAIFADWMGLLGGYLTGVLVLHLNASEFLTRMIDALRPIDILTGLIKATAFGAIIALTACYEGLGVRMADGAEGVGRATTQTVVRSGGCIIVVDALLTGLFYVMGLV